MVQKKVSTQKANQIAKEDKGAGNSASKSKAADTQTISKVGNRLKELSDKDLKYAVVEDLFNNYNVNTGRIYRVNFLRGIFFGAGSVIGGTVGIAFLVWFLSFFIDWPVLGEAIKHFLNALTRST